MAVANVYKCRERCGKQFDRAQAENMHYLRAHKYKGTWPPPQKDKGDLRRDDKSPPEASDKLRLIDAIKQALTESSPMHRTEIARRVLEMGYHSKAPDTVQTRISSAVALHPQEGVVYVSNGNYTLTNQIRSPRRHKPVLEQQKEDMNGDDQLPRDASVILERSLARSQEVIMKLMECVVLATRPLTDD